MKKAALISTLVLSAATANAATVINYDFNSDATNGSNPTGWLDNFNSTTTTLDVIEDSNDFFGQGTSNRVARYTSTATGDNGLGYINFTPTVGDFFTITFDYYMPANAGFTNGVDTALGNSDLNNSTRRYAMHSGPVSLDALVSASILVNESGVAKDYFNPVTGLTESLASGASVSFDYNHGTSTVSNRTNSGIAIAYGVVDKFGFKTSTAETAQFYFDDVVLHDNELFAAVPESSAALFVGLSALLLLRRRRA